MKTFIRTLALFNTNPDEEKIGVDTWERYNFSIDSLIAYNESTAGLTTIQLEDGDRITIAIDYNMFEKIMDENYQHYG